ncbi:MAG: RIO1 family regulatory kinase/ATPase domain-containing protein [Anaerolineae bacterium]
MTRQIHVLDEDTIEQLEDRMAGRTHRRPNKGHGRPGPSADAGVSEYAEPTALEAGFEPTYHPSRYERTWLLSSLRPFYQDAVITDILSLAAGGKEASVYCCEAHPSTGRTWLAAKVYRPRQFRSLRNDRVYREGRETLTDGGRVVNAGDQRILRALGKKTGFGVQVAHTSWLMHEYVALKTLYAAGADVPEPLAAHDNALVMAYLGEPGMPAPTLHGVRLDPAEAPMVLARVMRNVEIMLSLGMVHGDLSAYNVLYWQGEITLIDFPQVVNSIRNRAARRLLTRDVTRICQYFGRYMPAPSPEEIVDELWYRYAEDAVTPEELLGDLYTGSTG